MDPSSAEASPARAAFPAAHPPAKTKLGAPPQGGTVITAVGGAQAGATSAGGGDPAAAQAPSAAEAAPRRADTDTADGPGSLSGVAALLSKLAALPAGTCLAAAGPVDHTQFPSVASHMLQVHSPVLAGRPPMALRCPCAHSRHQQLLPGTLYHRQSDFLFHAGGKGPRMAAGAPVGTQAPGTLPASRAELTAAKAVLAAHSQRDYGTALHRAGAQPGAHALQRPASSHILPHMLCGAAPAVPQHHGCAGAGMV